MAPDLDTHRNVADAFAERAAAHPERIALSVYNGSAAGEAESLTFAQLARRAGVRAADLGGRLAPGDRVLVALPTCSGFVEVYLACLIAGLVAVPVPVPGGSAAAAERVAAIVEDCAPSLAVTTEGDRETLTVWLRDRGLGHVPVEAVGEAGPGEPPARPEPGPGRDTLAVLQYSSGSTGTPKGVMISHGNVLANVMAYHAGTSAGPGDAVGSWLPLHHDMGLFGMLTTGLLFGCTVTLMQPSDFIRRPIAWLHMLDRRGIAVTAAPNFAYELCLRAIPDEALDGLDLSRLRIAFNGSEPIHVPTMTAFVKRFARTGLRPETLTPAYGLAEATVFVSTKRGGAPRSVLVADQRRLAAAERPQLVASTAGDGTEVVGVGTPRGFEARIVDPATRASLPDGAVGEIWLRGASVGVGYWNRPQLSAEVFAARLADDDADPGGWLCTGDLGTFVDGELFVTGRIKEMMIVRGRNVFPQDVEHEARAAHPGLAGLVGAAFSVTAPDERIVLVHEVAPKLPAEELPSVAAAVTRRFAVDLGVPVRNVVLVRRGTVRRTTSGKIQRTAARERFLAGGFDALHARLEPDVRRLISGSAA